MGFQRVRHDWACTRSNIFRFHIDVLGFPGSSAGKEVTCNAGDLSLIPGLGRSPTEETGYPLQYSWAFLVAQMVNNPPAMQETYVWYLDWKEPLEEGMATHSSIVTWRISMDRGAWQATVHGVTKIQTRLSHPASILWQINCSVAQLYLYNFA